MSSLSCHVTSGTARLYLILRMPTWINRFGLTPLHYLLAASTDFSLVHPILRPFWLLQLMLPGHPTASHQDIDYASPWWADLFNHAFTAKRMSTQLSDETTPVVWNFYMEPNSGYQAFCLQVFIELPSKMAKIKRLSWRVEWILQNTPHIYLAIDAIQNFLEIPNIWSSVQNELQSRGRFQKVQLVHIGLEPIKRAAFPYLQGCPQLCFLCTVTEKLKQITILHKLTRSYCYTDHIVITTLAMF